MPLGTRFPNVFCFAVIGWIEPFVSSRVVIRYTGCHLLSVINSALWGCLLMNSVRGLVEIRGLMQRSMDPVLWRISSPDLELWTLSFTTWANRNRQTGTLSPSFF